MVALLLTLALLAPADMTVVRLPVGIVASQDMSDAFVHRICAEASAIWKPAGIAFEWHRVSQPSEAGAWITVIVDDVDADGEPEHALGWITFTTDGPGRSIHLSRAQAGRLIDGTSTVGESLTAFREILIGRALGRALAHEIGHYLLQSKTHTPHGLMRAAWTSDESFDAGRAGFVLTSLQRAAAVRFARATREAQTHDQ